VTDQDKAQFAQAMAGAAEVLGGEMTKPKLALYFKALEHLPIERVEQGLMRAVRELRFFPKPVEILDLAGDSVVNLSDLALIESSKAIEALSKVGTYSSVTFDDPVTMAVVDKGFGGWPEFSQAVRDEGAKWVGKDFCRFYETFARRGLQVHGHLPGISERDNVLQGYDRFVQPPALVGDPEKARAVLACGKAEALGAGPSQAGSVLACVLDGMRQ
jgi:hypothetical protein